MEVVLVEIVREILLWSGLALSCQVIENVISRRVKLAVSEPIDFRVASAKLTV